MYIYIYRDTIGIQRDYAAPGHPTSVNGVEKQHLMGDHTDDRYQKQMNTYRQQMVIYSDMTNQSCAKTNYLVNPKV